MQRFLAIGITGVIFCIHAIMAFAQEAPVAAPVENSAPVPTAATVTETNSNTPSPVIAPVTTAPQLNNPLPAPVAVESKSSDNVNSKEQNASHKPDRSSNVVNGNNPDRSREKNHDNNFPRSNHGKGDYHGSRPPSVIYYNTSPRVVYVYPQTYYSNTQYIETSSTYPSGYAANYRIGDFLPNNREWFKLPDYAQYSLPQPRGGEEWVYNSRDVILINSSSGRIMGALVLAAPIN